MPTPSLLFALRQAGAVLLVSVALAGAARAQGVLFRGIGAVNESMGGAGIAAPLDSSGAIFTNPATLSGLERNEMMLGVGFLVPKSSVTSQVNGVPATRATAQSRERLHLAPTFSIAYRAEKESPWTFGLASAATGGASAEYGESGSPMLNPILQGHSREAEVKIVQVLPSVSYQATEQLSLGLSGVGGIVAILVDPMPFGQSPTAPLLQSEKEYTLGYGFNVGAYYDFKNHFKTGFTVKSPMWTPAIKFTGADPATGQFVREDFDFNLPLILGWGVSYDGVRDLLLALDVRYFDYANTKGFKSVIGADGNVGGLGWDSIFSITLGAQYTLTSDLKIRAGYCWNENPIPADVQFANVASPLFLQHVLSLGASYTWGDYDFTATWAHAFKNTKSGGFSGGVGTVENSVSAETFFVAVTRYF